MPSGAQVTTGGTFRGVTPVTIDLSPGVAHAISVARAGYAPWTREVFAEPGKESTLDARLAALLVEVRIQGEPADAEVFVNGSRAARRRCRCSCPRAATSSRCASEGFNPSSPIWCSRRASGARSDYKLVNPKDIVGNSPASITTKSGIRLLIVAGGTYQAGTDRREQGRRPNEGAHKVTLLRPFYMGEREITNAQFRQFRARRTTPAPSATTRWISTSRPWSRVTWEDAAEFCNWLSAEEGLPPAYQPREGGGFQLIVPVTNGYRLPTEAEWEFVARAASTGKPLKYPWGKDLPVVSGTANVAGSEALGLLGTVARGPPGRIRRGGRAGAVRAESPRLLRLRRQRLRVGQRPLSVIRAFLGGDRSARPRRRQGSHLSRLELAHRRPPRELRFPWREGANEASDAIGFRVARYVAPTRRNRRTPCETSSSACSRSRWPP